MRKTRRILCMLLGLCLGQAAAAATSLPESIDLKTSYKKEGEHNPLYTQRFGADPGVLTWKGRVYVYMTNDVLEYTRTLSVAENTYGRIKSISCISSEDLVNWTDHGLIHVAGPQGVAKWASNSWAPCAAHKVIDGQDRFFLYFCNGGNGIGVLTSDSPTGPWQDPLGHLLVDRSTPTCASVVWLFDPAVLVDEDGTGYLAFGGGVPEGKQAKPGTGRLVRLAPDLIHLDGDPIELDVPWLFEDSGLNRIGDTYIYSYCSNWQTRGNSLRLTDGAIQYMTADHPMGPYTYAGELFPNEGRFFGLYGNNHHAIAELNGGLYLFYHSRPVERAMGISGNYRSPQVDRLYLEENGRLRQVVGTMKGPDQLKHLDARKPVSACTMANQAGIRFEQEPAGNRIWGENGSWLSLEGVDFGEGAAQLRVSAGSEAGAALYLVLDSLDGEVAARIPLTEGASLTDYTAPLAVSGVHNIYFVWDGPARFGSWVVE